MSSARPRVLIVAPSLAFLGGQAIQAQYLFEQLSREPGLEMGFLAVDPRLPGALGLLQKIKYIRTLVTVPAYAVSLLARVPHYDVLHIFSASYWSFILAPTPALLAGALYRKRMILNYRSGEAEDHLRRWRTALPTIRLADAVVVPSGYLVDVFRRVGVSASSICNTVSTERFAFRSRNPLRPRFLSNRNFDPMYNVGNTLRAFALVARRYPEARLTVAGGGKQRRELEELAAALELRNVDFPGPVPPGKMPDLYEDADIYLNSSEIDNMPTSIIEAFAAGAAVITTDAGGIPYIVSPERTALVVNPRDPQAMADCAFRLLENPQLAQEIIGNARRECDKYRWETVKGEWIGMYRAVAGRG
jgi:glycosyltransferase involved in cell wall biosynthesis